MELLKVWGELSIAGKRLACLALINGESADAAVDACAGHFATKPQKKADSDGVAVYACAVPGCGIKIEGESDPIRAKTALLTHQRLMHPDWQG